MQALLNSSRDAYDHRSASSRLGASEALAAQRETTLSAVIIAALRVRGHATPLCHGPESWRIFSKLCLAARARGKLVADAYRAALAIEHGCEFVTADADFREIPGAALASSVPDVTASQVGHPSGALATDTSKVAAVDWAVERRPLHLAEAAHARAG